MTVESVVDPTTVNGHDLPGDECAVVRGQVHECACKVGGVSSLGKRLALRHHPGEFRFIGSPDGVPEKICARIAPGITLLTRMPSGPTSRANARVKPIMPAFDDT